MSVRLGCRIAAVGALAVVALAVGACSGSTRASGPDGLAVATHASTQASRTPIPQAPSSPGPGGAPITVVTPPAGVGPTGGVPTASGGSTSGTHEPAQPATADITTPAQPAAVVTATPALNSTDVAPIGPISIGVAGGRLVWLTFANADGKHVAGTLAADGSSWTLGEPLGYGKTYSVTGVAVNPAGVQTTFEGTYRTATTVEPVTTSISPGDGAVVGVAAPVIVRFGLNPQDKALVERHVTITTTPEVEGAWAWITHDGDTYPSLDWRPRQYWPAGTKVHVESNVYGVRFADGWYGGDDVSVDFTIGRNQVVIADAKTHRMTVQRGGKVVATYNASLGMGDNPNGRYGLDPDLVTRSGIHVVTAKYPVYKMSNPKYGYTDVTEYWAVRISNNGEFIHNNPGTSAWQLANANVTHGCVNLAAANAKAYYESAIYGDPVEVVGTSVKLSPSDGDIYDWAIDWPTWQTLSALSPNSVVK